MQRETATMDEKKCFSLSLPLQWGKEFHTFVFASLERESDSNVRRACDVTFRACFPCVVPEAGSKRKRERKKSSFSTITLDCRIETNDDGKKKKKTDSAGRENEPPAVDKPDAPQQKKGDDASGAAAAGDNNEGKNAPVVVVKKAKKPRCSNPGVRVQGGRIYDSENGTTCHQVRCSFCLFLLCAKRRRYLCSCVVRNGVGERVVSKTLREKGKKRKSFFFQFAGDDRRRRRFFVVVFFFFAHSLFSLSFSLFSLFSQTKKRQ